MNDQTNVAKKVVNKVRRTLTGKITSAKMDKTAVVLVTRKVKHPLYKKYVQKFTKIHAHNADNTFKEGDRVIIGETRPISKTKSWEILRKA